MSCTSWWLTGGVQSAMHKAVTCCTSSFYSRGQTKHPFYLILVITIIIISSRSSRSSRSINNNNNHKLLWSCKISHLQTQTFTLPSDQNQQQDENQIRRSLIIFSKGAKQESQWPETEQQTGGLTQHESFGGTNHSASCVQEGSSL